MKILVFAATTVALVTPAFATDITSSEPSASVAIMAPVTTWSGLYVGGQAGGAFGLSSNGTGYEPRPGFTAGFSSVDGGKNNGFIGGGHVGYDYQLGNVVFGALADISGLSQSTTRTYTVGGIGISTRDRIDYLGTVRGRIGYAFDQVLVYGTGGLAYAGRSQSTSFPTTASGRFAGYNFGQSTDKMDVGYAVGGGAEVMAAPHLSLGLEYLYTNLGKNDWSSKAVSPVGLVDFTTHSSDRTDFHTVWAKASFRFDQASLPPRPPELDVSRS